MDVSVLPNPIRIHNALWTCFERQQGADFDIDGKKYHIEYKDTSWQHCARVVIGETIWASQNMRKLTSEHTQRILRDQRVRMTWAFRHTSDRRIDWHHKIESVEIGDIRHAEWENFKNRTEDEEWEFPHSPEVLGADTLFLADILH